MITHVNDNQQPAKNFISTENPPVVYNLKASFQFQIQAYYKHSL